jgi:hypothetical protein
MKTDLRLQTIGYTQKTKKVSGLRSMVYSL